MMRNTLFYPILISMLLSCRSVFKVSSFALRPVTHTSSSSSSIFRSSSTAMNLSLLPEEIHSSSIHMMNYASSFTLSASSDVTEAARQKFWFYFFAGSGAGGIGIAQVPFLFRDASNARAVVNEPPTQGGPALNAGPLSSLYYQSPISEKDVAKAIQQAPNADLISSQSTSKSYLASKGYIERSDFLKEMKKEKCNPLASYALFDAISGGKGDLVSPVVYDEKLSVYRSEGVDLFVGDLQSYITVKVGAFGALIFLLAIDFGLIAKAGIEGFLS